MRNYNISFKNKRFLILQVPKEVLSSQDKRTIFEILKLAFKNKETINILSHEAMHNLPRWIILRDKIVNFD